MQQPNPKSIMAALAWALPKLPASNAGIKNPRAAHGDVIRQIEKSLKVEQRVERSSYGQGYASFVQAWFYQDTAAFRLPPYAAGEKHYTGLFVCMSHLAPYYVMGEGAQSWSGRGGSSFMPAYNGVDVFATKAVQHLGGRAEQIMSGSGLIRLRKSDVAETVPEELRFTSNLVSDQHRLFDVLFFWND